VHGDVAALGDQPPAGVGERGGEVARLLEEGRAEADLRVARSVDLRYAGQNYEIPVPYEGPGVSALRAAFERRHHQLYGYATGGRVECVNVRVSAIAGEEWRPAPAAPAVEGAARPVGWQPAFFPGTGRVSLPRYERGGLPAGASVAGPALIEDEWSTTVVYPGQRAAPDRFANLVIEVSP